MAWGVFVFSKEGRERLAVVLRALLIGQLVVSLTMVIFCYNVSIKVMLLLKNIHKVTVILLYGLILLQAYAIKLHYTGGLRLIALILKLPYWSRIDSFSRMWMISGTIIPANGFLVYAACKATLETLTKDLSVSLCYGMSQYLAEPTWKKLMDTMQIELNCCGAEMPSDWHEIPWINLDFLNEDSQFVLKLAGADGKVVPPVTPYSCCTPRVLAACYHDPLQQRGWERWWGGGLAPAWLQARGCVEAARAPLTRALLGLRCFSALVALLQMVVVVLTQLVRSSARDAVLRGRWRGPGRAALIGAPAVTAQHEKATSSTGEDRNDSSAYAMSLHRRRRRKRAFKRRSSPCLS